MGKLQEMRQKMEESKEKLNNVMVEGTAGNGMVKVTANGNRQIKNIEIDPSILDDKEALEDLLIVAMNRALTNAEQANQAEMQGAAGGMLGDMGLGG